MLRLRDKKKKKKKCGSRNSTWWTMTINGVWSWKYCKWVFFRSSLINISVEAAVWPVVITSLKENQRTNVSEKNRPTSTSVTWGESCTTRLSFLIICAVFLKWLGNSSWNNIIAFVITAQWSSHWGSGLKRGLLWASRGPTAESFQNWRKQTLTGCLNALGCCKHEVGGGCARVWKSSVRLLWADRGDAQPPE